MSAHNIYFCGYQNILFEKMTYLEIWTAKIIQNSIYFLIHSFGLPNPSHTESGYGLSLQTE